MTLALPCISCVNLGKLSYLSDIEFFFSFFSSFLFFLSAAKWRFIMVTMNPLGSWEDEMG